MSGLMMNYVVITVGWFFTVLFGLLLVSMVLLKNWPPALVLLLLVLLCLPPVGTLLETQFGLSLHPLLRGGLIVGLTALFGWLFIGGQVTSVYKSPEIKARFMEIYDEKMTAWPVPYEDIFLETSYGTVHVIAGGPDDAPPLLLLHASGVAGWSWKYNADALSQDYRIYAIDLIGDAGKSEFTDMKNVWHSGKDQADLYAEITEKLGIEKVYVIGASEGGFVGSNFAMHYPERVKKLALLGPMGYAGALKSSLMIMIAQFFPLKPVQDYTFRWAFSDAPVLKADFEEWFRLLMSGYNANTKVIPLPFSAEQRQSIQVPVLFVFGTRDNLVGDPEVATAVVQDIPNVQVEVVEAGHLMGAEAPETVNQLILDFFAN
jgi:pimeloyl-ACP methyl ester carboxylesterase